MICFDHLKQAHTGENIAAKLQDTSMSILHDDDRYNVFGSTSQQR